MKRPRLVWHETQGGLQFIADLGDGRPRYIVERPPLDMTPAGPAWKAWQASVFPGGALLGAYATSDDAKRACEAQG